MIMRPARASIFALLLMASVPLAGPAQGEALNVFLDQATVAKLPERVTTIVVGNPLIADVTVQSGGLMVITGKGFGATNVIALDRAGNVLMEKNLLVRAPREEVVFVYRGLQRETYSCQPHCERRITLGDSPDFFNTAIGQTGARNAQAQAGGAPPAR